MSDAFHGYYMEEFVCRNSPIERGEVKSRQMKVFQLEFCNETKKEPEEKSSALSGFISCRFFTVFWGKLRNSNGIAARTKGTVRIFTNECSLSQILKKIFKNSQ